MRRVKALDDEELAERLVDHLLTCDVQSELREGESSYDVWVHDDRQMDAAKAQIDRFLAAPDAPEFADVSKRAGAIRAAKEAELAGRRNRTIDVRTERHRKAMEVPALTMLLIAICVIVGVLSQLGEQHFPFVDRLAFSGSEPADGRGWYYHAAWQDIWAGQVWRLVTPMFIHYGVLHLVFNMMWLKELGGQLEKEYGWGFFLLLVVATAVPAHVAQFCWSGPGFGGMSGVVYGLFGYIWARSRYEPGCRVDIDDGTARFMIIWLFLCMTGAIGPIANVAHVIGLVAGCVLGGGPTIARRFMRRFQR